MLSLLNVQQFRNIQSQKIEPLQVNLFYGENGSGKTSLLEAIYYLSVGRSFRTRHNNRIIQQDCDSFSLFYKMDGNSIGLKRSLGGDIKIRINEKDIHRVSDLASFLPVQLINYDSFNLLTASSKERRAFIDWGVFHVKHSLFFTPWKNLIRVIKQRNSLIKKKSINEIKIWNRELISLSKKVNEMRVSYLNNWLNILNPLLKSIMDYTIEIKFYSGWNEEYDLEEVTNNSLEKDLILGYTQYGAHRADIKFKINKKPVADVMSRGQQKMFIILMKIAQTQFLEESNQKKTVFLLDDLPAELDQKYREIVSEILINNQYQLFITGIEKESLEMFSLSENQRLYKIEKGMFNQIK